MSSVYSYSITVPKSQPTYYDNYNTFLELLIFELSSMFGIDRQDLYEKCRRERVRYCRWIIWEIMWATQSLSLKQTGRIFRDYDHTSVIHAFSTLPIVLAEKPYVKYIYDNIITKMELDEHVIKEKRKAYARESGNGTSTLRPLSDNYFKQKMNRIHNNKLKSAS